MLYVNSFESMSFFYSFRPSRHSTVFSSLLCGIAGVALSLAPSRAAADAVYPPVPNKAQLNWQDMEMYSFVHFTTNTFTDKEWGFGDESPDMFNPTDYNPDQIVKTLADAGFKGVVLTCKHHDGFCLWPTKTTKHSVASSSWKNGKGDVVRDFSNACKKYNVRFGVYVSPWDRNHPDYGTPKYLEVYRQQLKELLTNYGPIFMTWHDGANGGDGYYGGKNEKRSIDRSTYYDWANTWKGVKKYQPGAVIFSDVGPDVRWVGNEHGEAGYPCWATYTPRSNNPASPTPAPGVVHYQEGQNGTVDGKFWIPAEVDVSIRPGWFWHASENAKVRTPENLLKLYFDSVGRGAGLNLNVPPDRRGRIHEADQASLKEFARLIRELYSRNYAEGASVTSSDGKQGSKPARILDRKRTSYWIAKDGMKKAELLITLPEKRSFDVLRLAEPTQLGQRVRKFSVQYKTDAGWQPWISGSSVGARVILQGPMITTDQLRLSIDEAAAPPALSEFSLWKKPVILAAPAIRASREGMVTLSGGDGLNVFYTLDGSEPTQSSTAYAGAFSLPHGGTVKAVAYRESSPSAVTTAQIPVPTISWKVTRAEGSASDPMRMIDGDPSTLWHTHGEQEIAPPQTVDLDMGRDTLVSKVLYTPRKDGNTKGIVSRYEVYLSRNGQDWNKAAEGEFSNIKANPITQEILLPAPQSARYLRFVAKDVVDGHHVSIAELGVVEPLPEKK